MSADPIDALLEAERSHGGFSSEERARMWKSIALDVASVSMPDASSAVEDAAPRPASPSAVAQATRSLLSAKAAALLSVVALGSAGLGAAAHARWGEPRVVTVTRVAEPVAIPSVPAASSPAAAPTSALPSASASASAASPTAYARSLPVPSVPSVEHAASPRPASSLRDATLAREQQLLEMARTALTRSDTAAALAALETHARDYPASQLAEEREVMAVQSLAAAHRLPEARQRAAAFRTRFPKSALLTIVEESVQ